MRWKSHVRFVRRAAETHRRKTGTALRTDLTRNSVARPKGGYFHLYVLIDIYSRYNPGWIVSTVEESHWRRTSWPMRSPGTERRRTRSTPTVAPR